MSLPLEPDSLDEQLGPLSNPVPTTLRSRLLEQTIPIVRRRWRVRQGLVFGGLAACLLVGTILVWQWPNRELATIVVQPSPQEKPRTPPPEPAPTALAQEWRAVDATTDQAIHFLQAGDRYLEEEQDPAAALRCYQQALDAAPDQSLDFSPDDNWLVMALKDARKKEKQNATTHP